jgi:hypothetical protein
MSVSATRHERSPRHAEGDQMAKQTRRQREIVGRVMHEFKHDELESQGRKVRNPRQAIAIGLSEAGASNKKSAGENRRSRARTEDKERQGRTAKQTKESSGAAKAGRGRKAAAGTGQAARGKAGRKSAQARKPERGGSRGEGPTRADLYKEAQRRGIVGVSRFSKADLERVLKRKRG